jgi:hypothetical protein
MTIVNGNGALTYAFSLGDGSAANPYRYAPMEYHDALVDLGIVFTHSSRYTLANSATIDFLFTTPLNAHVELLQLDIFTTSAPLNFDLYKGAIVSANGTQKTAINNNFQSGLSTSCSLYSSPTITDVGTDVLSIIVTGDKTSGGIAGFRFRLILNTNEKHIIRIQNVSGGNANISIVLTWSED